MRCYLGGKNGYIMVLGALVPAASVRYYDVSLWFQPLVAPLSLRRRGLLTFCWLFQLQAGVAAGPRLRHQVVMAALC